MLGDIEQLNRLLHEIATRCDGALHGAVEAHDYSRVKALTNLAQKIGYCENLTAYLIRQAGYGV